MPLPPIPADHLIDPRVGYLGFHGRVAVTPPHSWESTHRRAEAGGYFRMGRAWTRLPDEDRGAAIRLVGMPTRTLYRPMIERMTMAAALEMGWTVDA